MNLKRKEFSSNIKKKNKDSVFLLNCIESTESIEFVEYRSGMVNSNMVNSKFHLI